MSNSISYRSSQLMNALIDQKRDYFTLKDAVKILPGKECQV